MKSDPDFDLSNCCTKFEILFIVLYFVYVILIYLLWNRWNILKPLKLFGVFVHEFSHASAAWLTCGKVKKIEVYNNEAGIAGFSGGWKPLIIPAGYVGGAFWGGAFVAISGHRIGATVAGALICFALLLALAHDPNRIVVYISVGFFIITMGAILIDWLLVDPFLQYVTLYFMEFSSDTMPVATFGTTLSVAIRMEVMRKSALKFFLAADQKCGAFNF